MSDVAHKNVEDELAELLKRCSSDTVKACTVVQKNQRCATDRDNCARGH